MDSQITDKAVRDKAHKICCEQLGGAWLKISPSEMSFTPVTGGMSNLLYCCSLPESIQLENGEPNQVLLRLYGEASRNSDMSLQLQIFELLSSRELGPKLYGNFDDGRLEEFLPASSLTCEELMNRDISSIIARKLATVHSLDVPNMDKNNTWIMDRFTEWLQFIESHRQLPDYPSGFLRDSTRKVAKTLMEIDFAKEIKFMSKVFEGTKSPIVFSHNDLHQGNILLTKPTKKRPHLERRIILIDFEYCSYNYRGYDIANHFSEWCFEYDTPEYPHFALYMDRFPSKDIQREFIRNYLDQKRRLSSKSICSSTRTNDGDYNNNDACSKLTSHGSSAKVIGTGGKPFDCMKFISGQPYHRSSGTHQSDGTTLSGKSLKSQATEYGKEVDAILNEVVPFCMAANLVWTFWCIKSAYSSNIKFGYWEHAMTRWQIYSSLKQSYITDRTTKRIRTPLATTIANGHSTSSPQLASTISEVNN